VIGAVLFALVACSGGKDDTGADTAALDPTLANVQAEILTPSCAFSSCHGSSGGGASDLDLSEDTAHAEVVGVESVDNPGAILVVAGDAASSYLVEKCTPGATGTVGAPMPEGTAGLDDARLALLVAWIDAGAPND
jgi:hypothetical protein